MAGITQTIPSYIQGISAQPDELKKPGQVVDMLNAIPDVSRGLIKRPGARLVAPLTDDSTGAWFNINRDDSEQYIGRIKNDGTVELWSCKDGASIPVFYSATPPVIPLGYNDNLLPGLPPLSIPSDWDEPEAIPVPPDELPGVIPPIKPEQPPEDGENLYPSCNSDAYNSALNEYRLRSEKVVARQAQLEKSRKQLDNQLKKQQNPQQFSDYRKVNSATGWIYVIKQGDFKVSGKDLEVNKPDRATRGDRKEKNVYGMAESRYEQLKDQRDRGKDGQTLAHVITRQDAQKGDLYAWKVDLSNPDLIKQYEDEIDKHNEVLELFKEDKRVAREAYEIQAAACGIFSDPYGYSLLNRSTVTSYPQLQYLKWESESDLQFLTINDYTFVTNRRIRVDTSISDSTLRPFEAIIELKNLVYNREYSVYFNKPGDSDANQRITSASRLSINKTEWNDGSDDCRYQGIENFTVTDPDDDSKKDLSFQIETRCQQELKDQNDQYKGYKSVYTTSVRLLAGGSGWKRNDTVRVTMKGIKYIVRVASISKRNVLGDLGIATYNTPVDGEQIVSDSDVLAGLKAAIEDATSAMTVRTIGNSLHVQAGYEFQLTTASSDLINVFSKSVNDVSRLPEQCVQGYVVKVTNSVEVEDDYYVRFEGEGGVSGQGSWEETVKPGIANTFNAYSMPHQIVRLFDENGNVYFRVSPSDWEPRVVGDEVTNPTPTFVGRAINKIMLFRNRMCFLSDENIVLSRPGDFFNFWAKTAMVVSPIDPIDINCSSNNPSVLYNGIEVNAGLLALSSEQQFLLTTDNDVLAPDTAKINTISRYGYNVKTPPISLGTTVGFVNNSGRNSRFFEITNIRREGEAEVLDQSKVIDNQLPSGLDLLAHSKANNIILMGTRGEDLVWGYQYFNSGEKRIQSAWFKWDLTGDLQYHFIHDDSLYIVVSNTSDTDANIVTLQKIDLKFTGDSAIVDSDSIIPLTVHLDNWSLVTPDEFTFDESDGRLGASYFDFPAGYFSQKEVIAWGLEGSNFQGNIAYPEVTSTVDSNGITRFTGKLTGDWRQTRILIGYQFDYEVSLPKVYVTRSEGEATRSDIRASLNIHRMKFSFGPQGVYDVEVKRKGKDTLTNTFEQREMDGYEANAPAIESSTINTIPIYDRNVNLDVKITSNYPSPATLYSVTWEGDYNAKFYKRV